MRKVVVSLLCLAVINSLLGLGVEIYAEEQQTTTPSLENQTYIHPFRQYLNSLPADTRILNLSSSRLCYQEDLEKIISFPCLEELDISNTFLLWYHPGATPSRRPVFLTGGPCLTLHTLNMSGTLIQTLNFNQWTPNLKVLCLNGVDFQGLSFIELAHDLNLEKLSLAGVNLTEENIEQLELVSIPTLLNLNFAESNVKGVLYHHFAPHLKQLFLGHTSTKNGDLKSIVQLENLEELDLQNTKISTTALKQLAKMVQLKILNLSETNLRDADFTLLTALTNLQELHLKNINLALADLTKLSSLTQLKLLDLSGLKNTNITIKEIECLQNSLPNCTVIYH